jgi:hypothetical protein
MNVPGIVETELGEETVATRVRLSGSDAVFVTPTRSLVYRAEGLLSDESVEGFSHDAERLSVSAGRRKATVSLDYAVDGRRTFTVPNGRVSDVVQPILAGLLRARGVTDTDERVVGTFRFSELTLVVTDERLIKHVGGTVWNDDYDSFHYDDVTGLHYEEGSVATGVVLTVDGRQRRIKTPNDEVPALRKHLESALFEYHDVASTAELTPPEEDEAGGGPEGESGVDYDTPDERVVDRDVTDFGEGVDPLDPGEAVAPEKSVEDEDEGGDETETETTDDGADGPLSAGTEARTGANAETDPTGPSGEEPADTAGEPSASGRRVTDGDLGLATAPTDGTGPKDANGGTDGVTAAGADADTDGDDAWADSPFDTAGFEDENEDRDRNGNESGDDRVAEELAELRATVERQNDLLAEHHRAIERLVEELKKR